MNTKYPLNEVVELFGKMRPVTPGIWYLYSINNQLMIHHGSDLPKDATVISAITAEAINNGMTPRMWQKVEDKIRILVTKGLLK